MLDNNANIKKLIQKCNENANSDTIWKQCESIFLQ